MIYKKEREEKRPISITCRKYTEENMERYKRALKEQDWLFVYILNDPNVIWSKMYGNG